MPHGGRNIILMALCQGGALLHSTNNSMFKKHFKPWAEVIGASLFTTLLQLFKTSSFEPCVFCNLYLQNAGYVNSGLSTSHGDRVPCV